MNDARDRLIAALAADARPVRHPGRIGGVTAAWLAVAIVVGIGGLLWHEPASVFRGPQLAQSPRFLLETVLGFAAIGVLALAAFRTGLPSPPSLHARLLPWLPLVAWGLVQVLSLWHPAIEPTMAGKRDHCVFEVLVLAVPGVVIGCLALPEGRPVADAAAPVVAAARRARGAGAGARRRRDPGARDALHLPVRAAAQPAVPFRARARQRRNRRGARRLAAAAVLRGVEVERGRALFKLSHCSHAPDQADAHDFGGPSSGRRPGHCGPGLRHLRKPARPVDVIQLARGRGLPWNPLRRAAQSDDARPSRPQARRQGIGL